MASYAMGESSPPRHRFGLGVEGFTVLTDRFQPIAEVVQGAGEVGGVGGWFLGR
jgi:hypothetical protein